STSASVPGHDGGVPTMDELREHAATITEILDTASERVERLAATDADKPALVKAIKQELSLSRRWNQHLSAILLDVAEARRALSDREREAAKEITRLTATAEEARLELIALKAMLKERPDQATQDQKAWSDSQLDQTETEQDIGDVEISGLSEVAIRDTWAMLASVQAAEANLVRDVDAVRGKIIEALRTLADVRGDLPVGHAEGTLSSEDITGWAASTATRLDRASRNRAD
ncbi:MAG: hypothetical protein AAGC99_02495, partial [Pseudomonadota bacterium]